MTGSARRYLLAKEVAQYLHVSVATVYRLADRGELPFVQIGGRKRFDPEPVHRLASALAFGKDPVGAA